MLNTQANINSCRVIGNGEQRKGKQKEKFTDMNGTLSVTSVGTITPLTGNITVGSGVRQRTGDTVRLLRAYLNFTIEAINADVFSSTRIIIFQWVPSTTLTGPPLVAEILQSALINAMYNFQLSSQYRILYDTVFSQAGITAAPASSGNQNYFGPVSVASALKQLEFEEGVVTGTNQLFMLSISDSLIAPFPIQTWLSRVIYTEDF